MDPTTTPWDALDRAGQERAMSEAERQGALVAARNLDDLARPDREAIINAFDWHFDSTDDPRSVAVAVAAETAFEHLIAERRAGSTGRGR